MSTATALAFEKAAQDAVMTLLATAPAFPAIAAESATQDIPLPRVQVSAMLAQQGPHEKLVGGTWYYDMATVNITVASVVATGASESAAALAGKVRARLTASAMETAATEHFIANWKITSSTRAADDAGELLSVEDTYQAVMFVKDSAWG